jgi:MOSC domain-containing protein YiiM
VPAQLLPGQLAPAARVQSVNVGKLVPNPAKGGITAFGKRPVDGPVFVSSPGCDKGKSGVAGDAIGDRQNHGGDDQAVYAFAREDLDLWETGLHRRLADGSFGENLTTVGIDPNKALIGERWHVGTELLLQVTAPRVPCKTFAANMGVRRWARRFTESGRPGAYLRVVHPGLVCPGDPVWVAHRPAHGVTISMALLALTLKPEMLTGLLVAGDDLPAEMQCHIRERQMWEGQIGEDQMGEAQLGGAQMGGAQMGGATC